MIETRHAIITGKDEEKNTLTIYNYDGKDTEHTFIGKDTVCVTRAGSVEDESMSILSAFQNSVCLCVIQDLQCKLVITN